ncbi:NADP-dependent oxidoreductase [Companilactobacillus sp. DQM5]|uniref:NADP-dependent oxidoreductase n=1 Tax=Companilactobacillus sp. DQM5 TaxID=3463359 RepID=UPI0040584072
MKAAQLLRYEKGFELQINEVQIPDVKDDEVLIKIKYAAVNPLDSLIGTGSIKLIQNYKLPQTMGNEITGIIKKVGKKVSELKIEDSVYARLPLNNIGGFSEYIAVKENEIALLPKTLDLKSAVAAPLTGLTSIQGMTEILKVESGKKILIPGGSGSFGQMAIPLAKSLGLEVIVTGNAEAKNRTLNAGADQYLDYKTENYWKLVSDVDYVIDTRGKSEFKHEISVMKPGGKITITYSGSK